MKKCRTKNSCRLSIVNCQLKAAVAAVALGLGSCAREVAIDRPSPTPADETTFTVSAATHMRPSTRAITERGEADNEVIDIAVLCFDDPAEPGAEPKFASVALATAVTKETLSAGELQNRWKFSAKIPKGKHTILVLANAAAMLTERLDLGKGTLRGSNKPLKGMAISELERELHRDFAAKYNAAPGSEGYAPFVMSSGREKIDIPATATAYTLDHTIPLVRDVAKINIRLGEGVNAKKFKINEIRLCNHNAGSYAVGTPALWSHLRGEEGAPDPLFDPAAPRPSRSPQNGLAAARVYTRTEGEITDLGCVDEIFTPERPATAEDDLYLLIKASASINGETSRTQWYKVALLYTNPATGNPEKINVLRNHSYNLTITSVSGYGYFRPEYAADSPEGNITVDLEVTDENDLNDIVYNKQYYLAVTKTAYTFSCVAEQEQELSIRTNYPGGWEILLSPTSLKTIHWSGSKTGEANVTTRGTIQPDANYDDDKKEHLFIVRAGNLETIIKIEREPNKFVFAPPGVVGIKLSDYRRLLRERARSGNNALLLDDIDLTVRGSSTYKAANQPSPGNNVPRYDGIEKAPATLAFGGLEDEPVYTTYNLWGSTIAILLGRDETLNADGRNVVWANSGYTGSTVGAWSSPQDAPFTEAEKKSPDDPDYAIVDNPAKGHGDICRSIPGGEYRTPAGNPWRLADGTQPFGSVKVDDLDSNDGKRWFERPDAPVLFWKDPTKGNNYKPTLPRISIGIRSNAIAATKKVGSGDEDGDIFLPAAGIIYKDAGTTTLLQRYSGTNGSYMTSTKRDRPDQLAFQTEWFSPSHTGTNVVDGGAVRCVKVGVTPPPPPPAAPVLRFKSTTTPDPIPQKPSAAGYDMTVTTNLPKWGFRIYRVTPGGTETKIYENADIAGPVDGNGKAEKDVTIREAIHFSENDSDEPREYRVCLFVPGNPKVELLAFSRGQNAAFTLPRSGFPAPPGVLGVTPRGELTLRGSKAYKGTRVERNNESEFGPLHEEDVYIAYFRAGSLVAINSTGNPDSSNGAYHPISNDDKFGFEDFDWIHPDYEYGGKKGARALEAQLAGIESSSEMWKSLPMNSASGGWTTTDTKKGIGDPCPFATIDKAGTKAIGYHVPSGSQNSWNGVKEIDFGSHFTEGDVTVPYKKKDGSDDTFVVRGMRDQTIGNIGYRMFMPCAGFRNNSGMVSDRGMHAKYWSNSLHGTTADWIVGSKASIFDTKLSSVEMVEDSPEYGHPIRCVKTKTE